jgi:hypothetical protein
MVNIVVRGVEPPKHPENLPMDTCRRPPADNRRRRAIALNLAGWLALAIAQPVTAQDEPPKPAKLFSTDSTLAVTLTAPWRELQRKEDYQGAYPARIEYDDEAGNTVQLELTVARRGIKRQEACKFPPIRLRFEKQTVKGTAFRGEKSLKMVTHCEKSKRFDQYYVLEMLAYRMYNLLTDYSFKVRPLEVTYLDSDTGTAEQSRFAFLIEDDSDVAKRNDLKKLTIPSVSVNRLEPEVTSLFSLFQYMIGNVDWAATAGPDPEKCCHNVKLIAPKSLGPDDLVVPVPYDFDSAGLVDAPYAAPPEALPIRSVTQRLFRGYCVHNTTLESARQLLLDRESEIRSLISAEDLLTSGSKKGADKYLGQFFDLLKDPGDFGKYVREKCRR